MSVGDVLGLAPAMVAAEGRNRDLGQPEVLRAAGAWLARICHDMDCSVVVAASRSAEWIVASALLGAGGDLRSGSADVGAERVIIVEGAVVTGSTIHHAAQVARSQGAIWVGAAVLQRTRPDLDGIDSAGFDLIADLEHG